MAGIFKTIGNIFTGGSGTTGTTAAQYASPFASQYGRYQDPLYNLVTNPSSITSTPGYQFRFDQGMQALERTLAAGGELNSGKALTESIEYGQNFATNELQRQEQLLSTLSGAGFGSPGQAGSLYAGGQTPINKMLSNLLGQGLSFGSSLFSGGAPAFDAGPVLDASVFAADAGSGAAIDAGASDAFAALAALA
jgi:hypothetical protein